MDFAQLDLKSASERGSWVHLSYEGKPLFADDAETKPCRLKVRGVGSKGIMDAFRAVERLEVLRNDRLARSNDKAAVAVIEKSQVEMQEAMADLIVAAVAEWENILWDGEPLEFNRDNLLKICGPGTLMFSQVNEAIGEARRLFTSAESA